MVSHDSAKFGGHRHFGRRDVMFFVVQGQYSNWPCLYLLLLFISKGHGLKAHSLSY